MSTYELSESQKKAFIQKYSHLPRPFLPWRWEKDTDQTLSEWAYELAGVCPLKHIPRRLYLKEGKGKRFQAPRFNFGWAMDCNTLWDIAHRCGFSAAYEGCTLANEGLGNDGLPHKPYIQTGEATRLLNSILEERFPEILADLGGHPVCVELARSKWDQASLCISITNSYQSGNKKPKEEHIAKLVEFFGIGRKEDGKSEPYGGPEPAWWLDGLWCVWRWYDARLYKIEMGLLNERY